MRSAIALSAAVPAVAAFAALAAACVQPIAVPPIDAPNARAVLAVLISPNAPDPGCSSAGSDGSDGTADSARAYALAPPFHFALRVPEDTELYALVYEDTLDALGLEAGALPSCPAEDAPRRGLPTGARILHFDGSAWIDTGDPIAPDLRLPAIDADACAERGGCFREPWDADPAAQRCLAPCPIEQLSEITGPTSPAAPQPPHVECAPWPADSSGTRCLAPPIAAIDPACARDAPGSEQFFDRACAPFDADCGDSWPVLGPGVAAIYVDPNASSSGADGTRAHPFPNLAEVLDLAPEHGAIALHTGVHRGPLSVHQSLMFAGACASNTVIEGAIDACAPEVWIERATITQTITTCAGTRLRLRSARVDARGTCLSAAGAELELEDAVFAGCTTAIDLDRGSGLFDRVAIRGATVAGIWAHAAVLDVRELLIAGSMNGLVFEDGTRFSGRQLALSAIESTGLYAGGGDLEVEGAYTDHTGWAFDVRDAQFEASRLKIEDARGIGVRLSCTTSPCVSTSTITTLIGAGFIGPDGDIGHAVVVTAGARAKIAQLSASGMNGAAVEVSNGASVVLSDAAIGPGAFGSIGVFSDAAAFHGARLAIHDVRAGIVLRDTLDAQQLADLTVGRADFGLDLEDAALVSGARFAFSDTRSGVQVLNITSNTELELSDLSIDAGDTGLTLYGLSSARLTRLQLTAQRDAIVAPGSQLFVEDARIDAGERAYAGGSGGGLELESSEVRGGNPMFDLCPPNMPGTLLLGNTTLRGSRGTAISSCGASIGASNAIFLGFETAVASSGGAVAFNGFFVKDTAVAFEDNAATLVLEHGTFEEVSLGISYSPAFELARALHFVDWSGTDRAFLAH